MARNVRRTQPRRLSFGRTRKERSGRWSAAYLHHGTLHRAAATFPTKDSAVGWLTAERKLIDLGSWSPPAERAAKASAKHLTLREYAGRWLAQRPLAPATHRSYEQALRRSILPVLGDMALAEITPEDVRVWFIGMGNDQETRRAPGRCHELGNFTRHLCG